MGVRVWVVVIHTREGLNFPMASVPAKGPVAAVDVSMETRARGKGPRYMCVCVYNAAFDR